MDKSIFTEKSKKPTEKDLSTELKEFYKPWSDLKKYVYKKYPDAAEEWNYSSFGWSYRIRDKKRVIIYLLPLSKYFKASFVFGEKATKEALVSNISEIIKDIIKSAKVYAEGRGFRIDVKDKKLIPDIKKLIDIKIMN
jgi:hypothetical protein